MNAEQLERAVDLLEKEDDMECHWSPYCSREGAEYVTRPIPNKRTTTVARPATGISTARLG